jgi:hypothetical protein
MVDDQVDGIHLHPDAVLNHFLPPPDRVVARGVVILQGEACRGRERRG